MYESIGSRAANEHVENEEYNICEDCRGSGISHYNSEYCQCRAGRELQGESGDSDDY